MAQAPSLLTPHASPRHFLGAELRCWRQLRGLSLAQLASVVFVSPDQLGKIEKADRVPREDVLQRCDIQLDTGGALTRLLAFVEQAAVQAPPPQTAAPSIVVTITAEIAPTSAIDAQRTASVDPDGGARIYAFRHRRGR